MKRIGWHRLWVIVLSLCSACSRSSDNHVAPARLPALAAPSTMAMAVSGFGEAVVSVPVGSTSPLPVVVAVIGIGDTAESQCETWRDLVQRRAFVLCPRGVPHIVQDEPYVSADAGETARSFETTPAEALSAQHVSGYFPPDLSTLDREVAAGMKALSAKYGAHVASSGHVYAGFSRGAFLGASLVAKHSDVFARAVLIEGGQTPWTAETAANYAKGGGKRIVFACGQTSCVDDAKEASAFLAKAGVETRVLLGAGEGHGYKQQVKEEVRRTFDWLVSGDPAWASVALGAP